jgi:hypothetical protein
LGTYVLAASFCARPALAAVATATAPVFVLSSTSVMCDTLMAALWVWSLHFWLTGLKQESRPRLIAAVMLAAACSLAKYFGIALVPLLFAASWLERRRVGSWAGYLAVPVAALALFHYAAYRLYGAPFLSSAVSYAVNRQVGGELFARILTGTAFCGGCMAILLFAAPMMWTRRMLAVGAIGALLCGAAVLAMNGVGDFSVAATDGASWSFVAQMAVWVAAGASLFALALTDWAGEKTAEAGLLCLWVVGTFVFVCVLNWTVSGRNILPMLPAVAILVVRRLERCGIAHRPAAARRFRVALLLSAGLALASAYADFALARSARTAAETLMKQLGPTSSGVAFEGHWGFQYYMEQLGARALAVEDLRLAPNEAIVVPLQNSYLFHLPDDRVVHESTYRAKGAPWLSTMSAKLGAGYYSDGWGPLPFVFGAVPEEEYKVFRVVR